VANDHAEDAAARHDTELFIRLLGENHRRLYLYVTSLVPNRADAEDILQQTNLVLWREFEQFEPGTNFTAWACRVALNQVLCWRKKRQRDRLVFCEDFFEAVAEELNSEMARLEQRSQVLGSCINKLPPHHRNLIRLRYQDGSSVESIASELHRTVDAVYRMLSRIRQVLHRCVTHSLSQEGVT
jgi:RNA polymerase sigma-70 factor (ECF subfamily)